MSLHYFIDGNNALHASDIWDHIPWASRRTHFLTVIADERLTGSERNAITVVFDGHGPRVRLAGPSSVEAVFSGDKDADTVIKERVDALKNPRIAVVVTNDRSIQMHVRKKGAKVLSCEDFLAMGKKKKSSSLPADPLDVGAMGKINDELKRIWKLK